MNLTVCQVNGLPWGILKRHLTFSLCPRGAVEVLGLREGPSP